LRIDGTVYGSVRCVDGDDAGMLVISENGAVEGEVRAAHLVVAGRVLGPVYTTEMVELQPTARITGDVHYRALEIHHGAVVEGRLIHGSIVQEHRSGLKLAVTVPHVAPKSRTSGG
jgi:cytoskeletal protein CcmA (bactofilin family)